MTSPRSGRSSQGQSITGGLWGVEHGGESMGGTAALPASISKAETWPKPPASFLAKAVEMTSTKYSLGEPRFVASAGQASGGGLTINGDGRRCAADDSGTSRPAAPGM